jgi:hypothetical protein
LSLLTSDQAQPGIGPWLASYPPRIRRAIVWYDRLNDWQRVQYALALALFLLACGGYLLGLGSTLVLRRVEVLDAALAVEPQPTEDSLAAPAPVAGLLALASPSPTFTPTAGPTATDVALMEKPTAEPFAGPQIAEPPAAPRYVPADPVVGQAPVIEAPKPTPTAARPRNLETSRPEPPAASVLTPTAGVARGAAIAPTAVRQVQPTGTQRPAAAPTRASTAAAVVVTARPAVTTIPTRAAAIKPQATVAATAGPVRTPSH